MPGSNSYPTAQELILIYIHPCSCMFIQHLKNLIQVKRKHGSLPCLYDGSNTPEIASTLKILAQNRLYHCSALTGNRLSQARLLSNSQVPLPPSLRPIFRTNLASGNETTHWEMKRRDPSQPSRHVSHMHKKAQASSLPTCVSASHSLRLSIRHTTSLTTSRRTVVKFSLTSRAERQAYYGAPWSSSHSLLVPNGRRTVVEFSLTSRAERQAHHSRVLTHLSCRTTGAQWLSSHSPLIPTGSTPTIVHFHSSTSPWLGHLGNYMITIIGIR
ncbi:unnamed protein product [Prunus armeniaca]